MTIFISILTILAVFFGLATLFFIAKKIYDLYIDLTEPLVTKAINNIKECLFES